MTGTDGFVAMENLFEGVLAATDQDVFALAVLVLMSFVQPEFLENNMFASKVRVKVECFVSCCGTTTPLMIIYSRPTTVNVTPCSRPSRSCIFHTCRRFRNLGRV